MDLKCVNDSIPVEIFLESELPGGHYEGHEYLVCNPTRQDKKPGSFNKKYINRCME